jgi:hypothetical protein
MSTLHSDDPKTCGRWPLWAGLLGPPVAWLVQLQVNYALVPWSCQAGNLIPLHIASGVFLVLALASLVTAARQVIYAGDGSSPEDAAAQCRLFLARLGVLIGLPFAALMIWDWIALFVFSPCL